MADRAQLEAAAAAGLLAPEQVAPLDAFLNAGGQNPTVSGEEDLRFIRNFHDVFLAIGIVLLALGMTVGIVTFVGEVDEPGRQVHAAPNVPVLIAGVLLGAAAGVMWLLGEFFARRRRLFLPAIAIVISLSPFVMFSVGLILFAVSPPDLLSRAEEFKDTSLLARLNFLGAGAAGMLAAFGFYWRFRLPFSLGFAGGCAALFGTALAFVISPELTVHLFPVLQLLLGVLLFLAGIAFDARDPARATRMSDNGFWLHFMAAPLILNGVFGLIRAAMVGGYDPSTIFAPGFFFDDENSAVQAGLILLAVLALGIVSLLINRRALIVSALLTTGIAIGVLLDAAGLGAGGLVASTLLTLGAFVLILGAGWHALRRAIVGRLKLKGFMARVIPPELASI